MILPLVDSEESKRLAIEHRQENHTEKFEKAFFSMRTVWNSVQYIVASAMYKQASVASFIALTLRSCTRRRW